MAGNLIAVGAYLFSYNDFYKWNFSSWTQLKSYDLDSLLVPRPHLPFEAQLVAGKYHEIGPISCPIQPASPSTISSLSYGKQKHDAEIRYPQRMRMLNVFPSAKSEVMFSIYCQFS